MTRTISIKDLESSANRLIMHLALGDELIVEYAGKPLVRISPMPAATPLQSSPREWGFLEGQIWIGPDFDAPLSEFEDLFYNGPIEPASSAPEPPL